MPTHRFIEIEADPDAAYRATRAVLMPHVDEGAFAVTEDVAGEEFGIEYSGLIAGARYQFSIYDGEEERTEVEARMWLLGMLGPVQTLLRRGNNRKHLDGLLHAIKRRAEGKAEEDADAAP